LSFDLIKSPLFGDKWRFVVNEFAFDSDECPIVGNKWLFVDNKSAFELNGSPFAADKSPFDADKPPFDPLKLFVFHFPLSAIPQCLSASQLCCQFIAVNMFDRRDPDLLS
jgi:hypothetical protein